MGLGDDFSGVTAIALWPAQALGGLQSGGMAAYVSAAAALAVPYFLFGNPVPIVKDMDFVTLGFMYGTAGASYWAANQLVSKVSPQ
jgi:hypothetical protein